MNEEQKISGEKSSQLLSRFTMGPDVIANEAEVPEYIMENNNGVLRAVKRKVYQIPMGFPWGHPVPWRLHWRYWTSSLYTGYFENIDMSMKQSATIRIFNLELSDETVRKYLEVRA